MLIITNFHVKLLTKTRFQILLFLILRDSRLDPGGWEIPTGNAMLALGNATFIFEENQNMRAKISRIPSNKLEFNLWYYQGFFKVNEAFAGQSNKKRVFGPWKTRKKLPLPPFWKYFYGRPWLDHSYYLLTNRFGFIKKIVIFSRLQFKPSKNFVIHKTKQLCKSLIHSY